MKQIIDLVNQKRKIKMDKNIEITTKAQVESFNIDYESLEYDKSEAKKVFELFTMFEGIGQPIHSELCTPYLCCLRYNDQIYYGWARVHPKDRYNGKIGKFIARKRAIHNLANKLNNKPQLEMPTDIEMFIHEYFLPRVVNRYYKEEFMILLDNIMKKVVPK